MELTERQQWVLDRVTDGWTWTQIGDAMGVSRQRAEQIGSAARRALGLERCPTCKGKGVVQGGAK